MTYGSSYYKYGKCHINHYIKHAYIKQYDGTHHVGDHDDYKGRYPEKNPVFIKFINGRCPPPSFYKIMLQIFLNKCYKVRKHPSRQNSTKNA